MHAVAVEDDYGSSPRTWERSSLLFQESGGSLPSARTEDQKAGMRPQGLTERHHHSGLSNEPHSIPASLSSALITPSVPPRCRERNDISRTSSNSTGGMGAGSTTVLRVRLFMGGDARPAPGDFRKFTPRAVCDSPSMHLNIYATQHGLPKAISRGTATDRFSLTLRAVLAYIISYLSIFMREAPALNAKTTASQHRKAAWKRSPRNYLTISRARWQRSPGRSCLLKIKSD